MGQSSFVLVAAAFTVLVNTITAGGEGVHIERLDVPDVVQNGTETAVTLDCDYSLEDSRGLVVKWFLNNDPSPVYQWIPANKPQDLGLLKGKLNLEYRASEDESKAHRALQIINPTVELSGEYTCMVSTFQSEVSKSKKMVVFVPEKNLELRQHKPKEDQVTYTCTAEGVFPEPNMTLFTSDSPSGGRPPKSVAVQTTSRNGLYDIMATVTVPDKELNTPTTFNCELRIPEANYTVKSSSVYYPGPPTTASPPSSDRPDLDAMLTSTDDSGSGGRSWQPVPECVAVLLLACFTI